MKGTVTISGLTAGKRYTLYRYDGTKSLPTRDDVHDGYKSKFMFEAEGDSYVFEDRDAIVSNTAVCGWRSNVLPSLACLACVDFVFSPLVLSRLPCV